MKSSQESFNAAVPSSPPTTPPLEIKIRVLWHMARNDGHCASVPVGQQPFCLSTRIPNYPFTSCPGIRNFKYSRGCCL